MIAIHYDYVIVGAGSAGCVLANRLSKTWSTRVLIVESGPLDGSITMEMPLAFPLPLTNTRYNWGYYTEPEPHMKGRRMYCPRGRVLGGSSSINGMVWLRGNPLDYEHWAARGLPEWSYGHCLPYFKRSESRSRGGNDYRGDEGPMRIATGKCENPLHRAFVDAGVQAGYPFTDDMNGFQQEGFGPKDMSVHRGRRWSAARGYMDALRGRENFKRELESTVLRLLSDGRRIIGVEYERMGIIQKVFAEKEVILCAGAINSPQLLMLSGIGPADHLKEHGISVVADLPGVGKSLQDHTDLYIQYRCKEPVSLYPATTTLGRLKTALVWLCTRGGPGASNQFESGGFIRSERGVEHPDLQFHFLPMAGNYDGSYVAPGHSFQVFLSLMRPTSRGSVRLHSVDPNVSPAIRFNYGATDKDMRTMCEGVKLTREIVAQTAFDSFRGAELAPGKDVRSDAEIHEFIRQKTETEYHPSSSCRMGIDDEAVVDSEGKVYGVEGLRIVDASIMPSTVSANLNATVIMMAEKLADNILGMAPLAAENLPFFRAPDWQGSQR